MEESETLRRSQRTRRPRERYGFSPETIERRRRVSSTSAVQGEVDAGAGGAVEDEGDGQVPGGLQSQA